MLSKKGLMSIVLVVAILFLTGILIASVVSADEVHTEAEEHTKAEEHEHAEAEEHTEAEEHEHAEEEHAEAGDHVHAKVPEEYEHFKNPFVGNESVLEAGEKIYTTACVFCHGKKGDGNGLAAKALKVKPADFTDKEMVEDMTDGFWFWRVSEGIEGSGMPAWKNVLNETQRWQVINYAMNFSKGPSVKKHEEKPFYLLTEEEASKKGAHIIGLVANISLLLMALVIFLMFKR